MPVRIVGRRKKRARVKKKPIKLIGKYFYCPRCGSLTMTVSFEKISETEKIGRATCGTCGLYCEVKVPMRAEKVDVYNMVADMAYEGGLESKCEERKVGEDMEEYAGEEEGE
ncbi:MAG: hypothetical protein N3F67_02305 [Acidilobaceae archaeon]|nr:hypothetical protein [Acidilobaceae archaeon]